MISTGQEPELVASLQREGVDVDASNLQRAIYSSDASLYRVPPRAVVFPRSAAEIEATLATCRALSIPLTGRGAGTSIAGNAIGTGVVIDMSRHMNNVLSIDVENKQAVVQPGVVQAQLQSAVASHGLRFGPDPSTSNRCTIGGMIGNNACGSRALAYGRTSDNVVALDILTGGGVRKTLTRRNKSLSGEPFDALRRLIEPNLDLIRKEFGQFPRQVSGYALETLLPEHDFDVAGLMVGSEGTLGITLETTVRLVSDPPVRVLVALGYPSMADAGDAAPLTLDFQPTACEGLDARIVAAVRDRLGAHRVPLLPKGSGWLFVELVGDVASEVTTNAEKLVQASGAVDSMIVTDAVQAAHLWRIREDGAGLASRTPDGRPAYAGWEDAAVPPAMLGRYLRDFDKLVEQHGLMAMPYGHFGDGCIHVRLDFPLTSTDGPKKMRSFIEDATAMVVGYGGSLSGEHGDGRARGEMLAKMYSPEAIALFGEVKNVFDPDGILNPGILVNPRPMDVDIRVSIAPPVRTKLAMNYHEDHGDFSEAVHKCVGVGKCRADTTATGGVMCPSYIATRDEKDSTRGRARVLQEMVNSNLVDKSWRSTEVHEALELCLSCKGCKSDCPTGIDMATYKAEVLHQSYKGRLRPRTHYSLGWLPLWAKFAAITPKLANGSLRLPLFRKIALRIAGVDQRRSLPQFAPETFRTWFSKRDKKVAGMPVVLWVDTFTDHFDPSIGKAAVEVLEAAGYTVSITDQKVCCGLTWISTGQLDTAKRKLQDTVNALKPYIDAGIPVVGLEPSCTGVLRSDITDLINSDDAKQIAASTKTLAELLTATPGWQAPDLSDVDVVAQPHCHHSAVMGWEPDAALLAHAGAKVERLGGCCGLAGNFGVEEGHHDVSVAVAEHQLLPAVRNQKSSAPVLADGFSCRTQLDDLAQAPSQHLAQLLAKALRK